MYRMVTIINNIVLYAWNFLREWTLSIFTTHTHKATMWGDVCVNLIVIIISQSVCTSNNHVLYNFVSYTEIKLKKKKRMGISHFHKGTTLFNFFELGSEMVSTECWLNDWLTEEINEEMIWKQVTQKKGQRHTALETEYFAYRKFKKHLVWLWFG